MSSQSRRTSDPLPASCVAWLLAATVAAVGCGGADKPTSPQGLTTVAVAFCAPNLPIWVGFQSGPWVRAGTRWNTKAGAEVLTTA